MTTVWENPVLNMRLRDIEIDWPVNPGIFRLAVVGEAPGQDEVRLKRVFVGKAGELLDHILELAGIPRYSHLITNVFHIHPTKNNIMEFFSRPVVPFPIPGFNHVYQGSGLHPDLWQEIPRLVGEIAVWNPQLIIALGNVPCWALCGHDGGITGNRGKIFDCTMPGLRGRKVLAMLHPSYILRQGKSPELINQAVTDLHFGMQWVKTSPLSRRFD